MGGTSINVIFEEKNFLIRQEFQPGLDFRKTGAFFRNVGCIEILYRRRQNAWENRQLIFLIVRDVNAKVNKKCKYKGYSTSSHHNALSKGRAHRT